MSRLIALLTDFGTADAYVGVMKGVMLGICPDLQFVDVTHAIEPQNIQQAAFTLLNSYRFFPPGTIFLIVVDPGVGSSRKPMALCAGGSFAEGYTFVAPDNGIISYVLRELNDVHAVELDNPAYHLAGVSQTFHGRDLFAPAAAHLAAGVALDALGSPLVQQVMLPEPTLVVAGKHIRGEVLHVDHFGNLVTSIGLLRWTAPQRLTLNARFGDHVSLLIPTDHAMVSIGKATRTRIQTTYAEVAPGEVLALVGSSGFLELAVNSGSFRSLNVANVGDPVEVQIG